MPEVVSVGGLLVPTLRVSLLLSLMLAGWLVARYAARLELDSRWSGNVAEQSVWLGLLGARLAFVVANWSAYSGAPWTVIYVWQGGFMPVAGPLAGTGYALWRLRQRAPQERGRYLRAFLSGFGVAALLFGLIFASTRVDLGSSLLRAGDPMPDFTLTDLRGEPVSFSSLEGRAVVLNFWATWCPPCRREMPLLDDLQKSTVLEA
jgi:cytochrome c biogenesis protein CcmG/thiol:disulfide interchange protein DsbE